MNTRAVRWGIGLGLLAIVGMPSRPAAAGERDAVADAVGHVMEAATTRMKAALEEARLLEAAGRRDDALARLRTVPAIHDDANRIVRTLLGGPDAPRPSSTSRPPTPQPPTPRPPSPLPPTVREHATPKFDPVPRAVNFLLRCQRTDGKFDPRLGAAPGDPNLPDAPEEALLEHTTGAVLLALLDVSGARFDRDSQVGGAIVRAADALAARAPLPAEAPLPTLAAWGLATAVSRTGEARWMPAVLHAVDATVEGWVPTLGRDFPSQLADFALEAAFLHEVLALPVEAALAARISTALENLRRDVRAFDRRRLSTSAQRVAYDLLVREPGPPSNVRLLHVPAPSLDPTLGRHGDPLEVLLGTVHARAAFGFNDGADGSAWWDDVLVPAMDRQARTGPTAGSWDPPAGAASVGSGRVVTTALLLLAWKVPSTPFLAPVPWTPAAADASDDDENDDDGDDAADDDDR